MESVRPVAGSIRALKEMRAMGIDVRICCPLSPSPNERVKWVEDHFHTAGACHLVLEAAWLNEMNK